MGYKFLPHTSEIKIQASGKNLGKAFEEAALALREAIAGNVKVKPAHDITIEVSGKDKQALLYNFLEEFLYLLDAEDFLLSEITNLEIKEHLIKARLWGDNRENYKFTNPVKAITYSEMKIKESKTKSVVEVVVDV